MAAPFNQAILFDWGKRALKLNSRFAVPLIRLGFVGTRYVLKTVNCRDASTISNPMCILVCPAVYDPHFLPLEGGQ